MSQRVKDFAWAGFFLLVAVPTLVVGYPMLSDVVGTVSDGVDTTGRIVSVRESCSQGVCTYEATVTYTVDGKSYESEMIVSRQALRQDQLDIKYLPSDPEVAAASTFREVWMGGGLTLLGAGLLVVAGLYLRSAIRNPPNIA